MLDLDMVMDQEMGVDSVKVTGQKHGKINEYSSNVRVAGCS
jgi:hypothetical protein